MIALFVGENLAISGFWSKDYISEKQAWIGTGTDAWHEDIRTLLLTNFLMIWCTASYANDHFWVWKQAMPL